jgi:hypothetical protein
MYFVVAFATHNLDILNQFISETLISQMMYMQTIGQFFVRGRGAPFAAVAAKSFFLGSERELAECLPVRT